MIAVLALGGNTTSQRQWGAVMYFMTPYVAAEQPIDPLVDTTSQSIMRAMAA